MEMKEIKRTLKVGSRKVASGSTQQDVDILYLPCHAMPFHAIPYQSAIQHNFELDLIFKFNG